MLSTEDPQPSLIAKADSRRIAIYRAGEYAPLVTQNAPEDRRLFLHPLRTSDGAAVLTEDAPPHHLWQHGLYTGLNEVNGIGFWYRVSSQARVANVIASEAFRYWPSGWAARISSGRLAASSVASSATRSSCPLADRYSIMRFCCSTYPRPRNPSTNAG